MSIRHVALRAILLASAASVPVATFAQPAGSPSTQSGTADVIRVLLDQSAYWRTKSETKLADEALSRVLALDPGNVDALAQQAQAAADKGDRKTAQDALTRLQVARPDDPRITSIQQSLRVGPVDQSALTEARRLAQDGKPQQALDAYRRVFKGDVPPPSLATEFYQTLGATEGNWEAAREGLAAHLRADPQDLSAQLAYAALLTYRDETRDEGVQRLAFLTREAQVSQQADRAWRQALSWLPATQASAAKYTEYLAHNPDDTEVQHWRTVALNDTGTLRGAGFDDLTNNRLAQAEAEFTKALAVDANDSDSLIGLALVRFKQNRQNDGRDLIRKAVEIDPSKATQYQSMLDTSAASRTAAGGNGGGNNGRNGGGVDYGALSARKIRGDYARVAALTQRGDYAAAETLLRQLMGKRPNAGNYLQMGDIQRRAGQFGEAEASFRIVLRSQPHNVAALGGLAAVLAREGKTTDADQAYAQAQSFGGGNALGQNRAQQLRQQAQSVSDPVARTGLFRAAVAADPANPWLRLELARALLAQDREAEARSVMAPVTDTARPTVDQLKAGIYFATSDHQNALAANLVARLPASARTPDFQEIGVQAEVAGDVQDAKQLPNVDAMEQRMVALAAKPDPTGARASQFATALTRAGDKQGARNVIRAALAATRTPTPQQRIAYAGALIGAGYPRDAKVVTAGLSPSQLNPLQRSTLTSLQDDAAVSAADSANSRGQTADALSELSPRLQRDPSNPALNMALARVYQTEKKPGTAVAITQELLRRNPGDVQVRVAAVSAALAAGEADRAATMARQLTADFPEDPQGWFVAAQVARSRGDSGAALTDLRRARDLRTKQLAGEQSDASDVLVPGWLPGRQYALNWPPDVLNDASPGPAPKVADAEPVTREYERYAQTTAAPYASGAGQIYLPPPNGIDPGTSLSTPPGIGVRAAPPSFSEPSPIAATPVAETLPSTPNVGILTTIPAANPTRSSSAPTPDEPTAGSNLGVQLQTRQRAPTDPLTADIDRSIQQVSETIAPQIAGSLSLRGRSGSQGLSELFDVEAPLEASFSPNGYGRLKVQVTPVYLYAGQPSAGNRALFGTNPLIAASVPIGGAIFTPHSRTTTAAGSALDVSYAYDFVTADIGTSPIGFEQKRIVGGIQFLPRLTNNLLLRLTADRRSVTDSLLSYAGQTDSRTGERWGGVTRNRVYAQLEGSVGTTYYYAGAGAAAFLGEQVASNTDVEAGAGVSTPVWTTPTQEVRVGANAVYFGFRRNEGNFTVGSGGYFSPQQYFALLFPVTYKQQLTPDITYTVGGTVGAQTFRAKTEPVFLTGRGANGLEAQLQQEISTTNNFNTRFPGFAGTGIAGGVNGEIDYRLNDNLHVGAKAGFDRSGNFTEGTGLVYARYVFNNPQPQ